MDTCRVCKGQFVAPPARAMKKDFICNKQLAKIKRGGVAEHEAFVVTRIGGLGESNLAPVDPPVVGLANTDDGYYEQYFRSREELEGFIAELRKAADEAWGSDE